MAATERVTVRMSRSDANTPWGFRVQGGQEFGGALTIGKVNEGSLADRAGLQEGDKLLEVGRSAATQLSHQGAQDAIVHSGNILDLVVERLSSRTWKSFIPPIEFPETENVTTSTVVSRPFGQPQQNYSSSRTVVTEQHSNAKPGPGAQYQYSPQTGGQFGTAAAAHNEDPTYLKSQTLRMIKESESHSSGGPQASPQPPVGGAPPPPPAPSTLGGAPACDNCGRLIHGVFCKAGGKTLHGDCFKCATCAGSLKNVGYFLLNGKLFCDIHARQQQENQFKAAPPVDPNLFHSYPTAGTRKPVEPPKSLVWQPHHHAHADPADPNHTYQPSILQKGRVNVNVPPPGSFGPRGGNDYSSNYQYRKTTTTTSTNQQQQPYSASYGGGPPVPPPPSWQPSQAPAPPPPPPPSQPLSPPQLRGPSQYQSGAPSPRSTSYNVQSDKTATPQLDGPSQQRLETPFPNLNDQSEPASEFEQSPRHRKREKWPPPPDPTRLVVPYWRIPVGLSSDFGPGASLTTDDDYRRIITYRHTSEIPPPKPRRNFLLEDVQKLEEWKLEQERLAPSRAVAAAMINRTEASQHPDDHQELIVQKIDKRSFPVRSLELWQDDKTRINGHGQDDNGHFSPHGAQGADRTQGSYRRSTNSTIIYDQNSNFGDQAPFGYGQAPEGFFEGFEPIRSTPQIGATGQQEPLAAFEIDTRTEYRHFGNDQGDDPLAELTRDLLKFSGATADHETATSNFESVSTTTKFGGGTPSFGVGRQPAAGAKIPRRGRGILKQSHEAPRIPVCESCNREIRGPFVLALSRTWCPDHFVCATANCHQKLLDIGFVEENGLTYCEFCYAKYLAPTCTKCSRAVVGDCLTALGRQWHPECFLCSHCRKPIGNSAFYMENGQPFCENDWSSLFTTKCVSCQFAIDPGDRWVEALGSAYHSECFSCSVCQKNLEGQSFFAKGGRPYCKTHA